jgi:8-oxo-dGTP pyrophosphatase MutT (NUDIX family)
LSAFTWPPEPSPGTGPERGAAGEQVPAAVLAAIFLDGEPEEPYLVLTRRRADLRRHAGEISFPGGRSDAADADLAETALREAEEEIGLPRAEVTMLGTLPPVSTFVTNYIIHPFVASIPAGIAWSPSPREVDAVLELPMRALMAGRTRTRLERRGISFETDAYVVDDHLIWGATARIIEHLLERLQSTGPSGALALRES